MLPLSIRFSARRGLGAVVAAALVAAVVVQFDGTPRAASSGAAGEAMMQVLIEEHATIAGYLKQEADSRTQANTLAARDLEQMKLAALEEAQSSLRLAQAVTPVREEKPKVTVVRVAARYSDVSKSDPIRPTTGSAAPTEPMQLLAMTDAEAMQAPRPPGLVRGRANRLASTVERIPSWFNAAAGWVVDVVPRMPSLPQLPMRHFRV